jgi:hypothetical protein
MARQMANLSQKYRVQTRGQGPTEVTTDAKMGHKRGHNTGHTKRSNLGLSVRSWIGPFLLWEFDPARKQALRAVTLV